MTCNHPLAARAIECVGGLLRTYCWACRVEDSGQAGGNAGFSEAEAPLFVAVKNGIAAVGDGWAVFGSDRKNATTLYFEAIARHADIRSREASIRTSDVPQSSDVGDELAS